LSGEELVLSDAAQGLAKSRAGHVRAKLLLTVSGAE